jgi:anti-sigma regulatory factor (Ser/Thr protein kinase)
VREDAVPQPPLPVTEASQVGEARRLISTSARKLGFDETAAGKVAIVVTEMAGNLVKHAGGGEIVVRALRSGGIDGLEILALDRGPGMADLAAARRDGYSTAGSPGTGLGAIARLSDLFDVYSAPGQGTALVAQLWAAPLPRNGVIPGSEWGSVCLPVRGEEAPGDGVDIRLRPGGWRLLVADGLGHGPFAREAAQRAIAVSRNDPGGPPARVLEACHDALRSTRGAAVAVADVDFEAKTVRFAGVGNITGVIEAAGRNQHLVSFNGIIGQGMAKIREFSYPWSAGALLIMASDGLSTRWRLDAYPGLAARHPSLIAGVLYRDFGRPRDDATVAVVRELYRPAERTVLP